MWYKERRKSKAIGDQRTGPILNKFAPAQQDECAGKCRSPINRLGFTAGPRQHVINQRVGSQPASQEWRVEEKIQLQIRDQILPAKRPIHDWETILLSASAERQKLQQQTQPHDYQARAENRPKST